MTTDFYCPRHKITIRFAGKESGRFVQKDGKVIEKGEGYAGRGFWPNGATRDARRAVEGLVGKSVARKRLGAFHPAFGDLR